MRIEELRFVCEEAARRLLRDHDRPVPTTIVVPGSEKNQLVELTNFPDDDEARHELIANFAHDELTVRKVPAWGFIAEASVGDEDIIVMVYGARKHAPKITAAVLTEDADGDSLEFEEDEELDPTAMPFLHPLQHAVDALEAVADPNAKNDEIDLLGRLPMIDGN